MTTHKKPLTTIIGAALALTASVFTFATPATATDTVCVEFETRFIGPGHVNATAPTETVHLDTPLPAGDYYLQVRTSDGYEGRASIDEQQKLYGQASEVIEVLGVRTPDLPDDVDYATATGTGTVTLDTPLETVTAVHRPAGWLIDSVRAVSACFAPVSEPDPEPVSEPAPTPNPTPEPAPAPEPQPEPTPELVPVPEIGEPTTIEAPTPTPVPAPDCEKEGTPCLPECPEGEMRTRSSGSDCEAIVYCPTIPVMVPVGDWDAFPTGETITPMSPTGLLEDCPGHTVPVVVSFHFNRCDWL